MSNRRKLRNLRRYDAQPIWLPLRESDTAVTDKPAEPTATTVDLREVHEASLAEASAPGGGQLVQIISAGWGSSGYYPDAVLKEAADQRVFTAGLPMYLDHPTMTEEVDRPERSVRDLAATLTEDARYDPDRKALVAQARVLPHWREMMTGLAEHVGLSIRADGLAEIGEAEGRAGLVVKAITNAHSVDYVTKAGRGGKVLALLESARSKPLKEARTFGAWLESRLHLALTQLADEAYGDGRLTREERITLSSAIGDALQVWTSRVEADAPQLFARDLYDEPAAEPVAVVEAEKPDDKPAEPMAEEPTTELVPAAEDEPPTGSPAVAPADSTTEDAPGTAPADEETEGVMPEDLTIEVKAREAAEQRASEFETKLREAEAARQASDQLAAENALKLARFEAVEAARPVAETALAESDLPQAARARVLAVVVRDVPLNEAHKLDETAFRTRVDAEIKGESAYLASLAEADGAGKVTGMGGSPTPTITPAQSVDTNAVQAALIESYKARGMSDRAAQLAATGRPF